MIKGICFAISAELMLAGAVLSVIRGWPWPVLMLLGFAFMAAILERDDEVLK